MADSKRGRISNSDRERIQELASRGESVEAIASAVERRVDVVQAILGALSSRFRGRMPKAAPAAAAAPAASKAAAKRAVGSGLLSHSMWLRPGIQLEFSLPADLTQAEAERLCTMVRALPFGS
jgi:hypothetical protein